MKGSTYHFSNEQDDTYAPFVWAENIGKYFQYFPVFGATENEGQ
jgi:hypothetical protein